MRLPRRCEVRRCLSGLVRVLRVPDRRRTHRGAALCAWAGIVLGAAMIQPTDALAGPVTVQAMSVLPASGEAIMSVAATTKGHMILGMATRVQALSGPNPPESWWKPWTWRYDERNKEMRDYVDNNSKRIRVELRAAFQMPMILMAFVALGSVLIGTQIAERLRSWAVARFAIPPAMQRTWSVRAFFICASSMLFITWVTPHFAEGRLPVFLLLVGLTYVFFTRLLPVISTDQVDKRKVAVGQLKTLGTLAVLVLVMLQILSDAGLFGLKIGI